MEWLFETNVAIQPFRASLQVPLEAMPQLRHLPVRTPRTSTPFALLLGFLALFGGSACATMGGHKLRQVYYFGVFDPTEQLPPSVYRIRVRGTSSTFSRINYAAGWVPARFVDSVGTSIRFDEDKSTILFESEEGESHETELKAGRRLLLWGPEGFRESPANQRLAVVMAASPERFFAAIDDALGQLSAAKSIELTSAPMVEAEVYRELVAVNRAKNELDEYRESLIGEETE